jgi:hypothetical protein
MTANSTLQDRPFGYRETKHGAVLISYRGKIVTTLRGKDASKFLSKASLSDEQSQQLLMAKVTGHFKRGNETSGRIARR